MPIDIHIRLEPGENLQDVLRAAGFIGPATVGHPFNPGYFGKIGAADAPPAMTEGLVIGTMAPAVAPLEPVTVAAEPEPEAPKRGRPRGSTRAAIAAAAEPEPFIVRRYGGQIDSEHDSAVHAYDRLRRLMNDAAGIAALDAVLTTNEALSEALPAELTNQITALAERLRAALASAAEPEPEPAPALPAWPLDLNKAPLVGVTLNRVGAQNAISAIATGAGPKFGMVAAVELLERHGVQRISEIADDADPKLAAIAAEAAGLLGLPVVE